MVASESIEEVINEIGMGRWQVLTILAALVVQSVCPVLQLGSILLSAPVPFRCSYPEGIQGANMTTNSSADTVEYPSECLLDLTLMGFEDIPNHVSKTNLNQHHTTGLPSCPEVEYDTSSFQSTVITEWDLVCEKSTLRPLYQMMFSIGSIFGSTFCGQLSDWLGRKRTLQMGVIMTLMTVVATSMVPWYGVMLFLRILSGVGTMLMVFPTYTMLSEMSPLNRRTIMSSCPGLVYFVSLPIFSGVAYLVPHWRKLLLICNTPLLLLIPVSFVIDESPRWLLQKGRRDEAVGLLRKAAKQNGVTINPSFSLLLNQFHEGGERKEIEASTDTKSQGTFKMLQACISYPGMRSIVIVLPMVMFLKRCLHIGVLLNANNFTSTNPFQYVASSGVMGVVAIILSIPVSHSLGRRVVIGGALFIGGTLLLLEMAVPSDYWWSKWILVMTSFCIVCGAFQITYVFSAELFPTVIRTRGFTFTNFVGYVGEMIIPLITETAVQYQWWAASVSFGCAGVIGSLLVPLLPETKDKPMPETLQDVEDRYWNDFKGRGSKKAVRN